jgi:hypothetical protein
MSFQSPHYLRDNFYLQKPKVNNMALYVNFELYRKFMEFPTLTYFYNIDGNIKIIANSPENTNSYTILDKNNTLMVVKLFQHITVNNKKLITRMFLVKLFAFAEQTLAPPNYVAIQQH